MRIEVSQSEDHWRADCLNLSGSPPVGLGDSPEMAVACLFWRMLFEPTGGPNSRPWTTFLKREPIVVNGRLWDWPESYKKEMR